MKYYIAILTIITSLAFAENDQATFEDKVYPLIKQSKSNYTLFSNFDFHPTYVYEKKEENSHTISTLISHSPSKDGSAAWSHFVTFNITTDKENKQSITSVNFRECNLLICFQPKQVVSVDSTGKLIKHDMSYPGGTQLSEELKDMLKGKQK